METDGEAILKLTSIFFWQYKHTDRKWEGRVTSMKMGKYKVSFIVYHYGQYFLSLKTKQGEKAGTKTPYDLKAFAFKIVPLQYNTHPISSSPMKLHLKPMVNVLENTFPNIKLLYRVRCNESAPTPPLELATKQSNPFEYQAWLPLDKIATCKAWVYQKDGTHNMLLPGSPVKYQTNSEFVRKKRMGGKDQFFLTEFFSISG